MQAYQINELERLTGIKAHTIRIWEKRYGLIEPYRTATNRRFYNDDQVKKLLNVSTLLAHGRKISRIAALSEAELIEEILDAALQHAQDSDGAAGYINDLTAAMLVFDEPAFEKVFIAAVAALGMYECILQVIYPFLNKVGMMWSVNKTAPVQEHFATGIIRRKLMAATDALPMPVSKKKFLLFLPQHEWHEVGLLFADYMIRANGHNTIYLGQNVPMDNVAEITGAVSPDYLLLFYIAARPKEEVESQVRNYAAISKSSKLLVAGNADILPLTSGIKNTTYLTDVNALLHFL